MLSWAMGSTARALSRPRCSDWPNLCGVLCHLREAPTEEAIRQVGHDLLRHLAKNMLFPSVATLPLLQAYWNQVKRYEPLHGFKVCFETTWIGKP
jgi:hypothetical protein